MQQPTARFLGLKSLPREPPPPPVPIGLDRRTPSGSPLAIRTGQIGPGSTVDALGNSIMCEDGTIPMRRITLEELTRFQTLDQFFQKYPHGTTRILTPNPAVKLNDHKHAHSYQYTSKPNIGGSSDINLWNPTVVKTGSPYTFSLSQQWYVNFIGNPKNNLKQTVEGGWQKWTPLPKGFSSSNSALFVYWTADNYVKSGCYNLSCMPAFMQTNKNWFLGGGFPQNSVNGYSVDGGPQYYFTLQYFNYQGNWWLNLNGEWVGLYPGSFFKGNPMATSAALIDYGGETDADNSTSMTVWPPMGSGKKANVWWTHAAFQRNIYYFPDTTHAVNAVLTPSASYLTAPNSVPTHGRE
jgi:Neprosin